MDEKKNRTKSGLKKIGGALMILLSIILLPGGKK